MSTRAASHWATISAGLTDAALLRGITTRSTSGGHSSWVARNASRSTRFTRDRVTELPTFFDTVSPRRAPDVSCRQRNSSVQCGVCTRLPRPWIATNSQRLRTRRARSNLVRAAADGSEAVDALDGAKNLLLVGSHSEAVSPLASAILQHGLSAARLHAFAKTVSAEPAGVVRLECTLHFPKP